MLGTPTIEEAQYVRRAGELIHSTHQLEASHRSPSQSPLRHRVPERKACTSPPHESKHRRLLARSSPVLDDWTNRTHFTYSACFSGPGPRVWANDSISICIPHTPQKHTRGVRTGLGPWPQVSNEWKWRSEHPLARGSRCKSLIRNECLLMNAQSLGIV